MTSPVIKDAYHVVRDSSNNRDYVHIREDNIASFCDMLVDNNDYDFEMADWDAPVFPSFENVEVSDVVDFFFVGNAINYCFNDISTGEKFTKKYDSINWSGAFGMWASLMKEYQQNPDLLNASYLRSISLEDAQRIFDPVGTKIPMIQSRVKNLNNVGKLMDDMGGTFWNMIDDTTYLYENNGVIEKMTEYSVYQDTRKYNGRQIRFDKRAQLAVSMLYGKLHGTEYEFEIGDMHNFTVFADYGIPAGLASFDILEYDEELTKKIQRQKEIKEGSPEEIQIRANTVVAGDKIQTHLSENYPNVSTQIPVLDYVLWQMRKEADTNAHITKTEAY